MATMAKQSLALAAVQAGRNRSTWPSL